MFTRHIALTAATALPFLFACGGGGSDSGWAGTVTDSAGVQVVSNPVGGMWAPGEEWAVEEVLSIGSIDAASDYQFGQIVGVDADADGNVYVADLQTSDIRAYDATGTYLRTIGSKGKGPGELGFLVGLYLVGDTMLVPDIGNQRVARFLRDGTFLDNMRLDFSKGVPTRWDIASGGRIVAQKRYLNPGDTTAVPRGDAIVTLAGPGEPVDTLAVLPIGQAGQVVGGEIRLRIFAPEPAWDAGPDGRLVTGMSDRWRFEVWSEDGSLARVFSRPSEQKPVTERDQRVIKSTLRKRMVAQGLPSAAVDQAIERFQFAETYPAFALIALGPEATVWVQNIRSGSEVAGEAEEFDVEDLGSTEWGVFDGEGRYLGSVSFPGKYQPIRTMGDRFYGVARDELNVQSLKVYRVVTR